MFCDRWLSKAWTMPMTSALISIRDVWHLCAVGPRHWWAFGGRLNVFRERVVFFCGCFILGRVRDRVERQRQWGMIKSFYVLIVSSPEDASFKADEKGAFTRGRLTAITHFVQLRTLWISGTTTVRPFFYCELHRFCFVLRLNFF